MRPRNLEAFLLGAALGATLMFFARADDFGRLAREIGAAEDSLSMLTQDNARLTVVADSLGNVAHTADTVLVTVTERTTFVVQDARERAGILVDSLRLSLDSAQSVMLANVQANHESEVAAVWRVADARLSWGTSWRDYAIVGDSLAGAQSAQIALHAAVNNGLRSAMRRQAVTNKLTQLVAVGGAGKVCYDAVNDGHTGLAVGSCTVAVWAAVRP